MPSNNNRSSVNESHEMHQFMGEMRASMQHREEMLDMLTERFEDMERKMDTTNVKVDGLLSKITKWEAKLGAFMFIAACLWAFFLGMKEQILTFIKG